MSGVAQALDEESPAPPPQAPDSPELQRVCIRLAALLAEYDAEASDLVDTHGRLLEAAFGDSYGEIERSIQSFSFPEALTALRNAAAHHGIAL